MTHLKRSLFSAASLLAASFLATGCSTNFNPKLSGSAPLAGAALQGRLMGGQQPILGAHIYLMAAGSGGYGTAATSLLAAPNGTNNTVADGNSRNYVLTSNTTGNFSITGDYTCPSLEAQTYLLSVGGDPGGGTSNTAAILMAALGRCGDLSSSTFIIMNELTAVAGITALQQFATGPFNISASSGNAQGLQSAFILAKTLVNISNGVPQASTAAITYPEAKIYTLGNSMAACVNSGGGGSGACGLYFTGAVDPSTNTPPTDTFQAMLNIARYPAADPTDVLNAGGGTTSYGNRLSVAPHDFSLPIVYTAGGLKSSAGSSATSIAIDGSGNAWVSLCGTSCDTNTNQSDSLVLITPGGPNYGTGFVASGAGYGIGSVHNTTGVVLDQSNYAWAVNDVTPGAYIQPANNTASVSIFSPGGTQLASSPITSPSFVMPAGIAIDTNGASWITDPGNATVFNVTSNGTVTTPLASPSVTTHALTAPTGIAFDTNGNLIVADSGYQAGSVAGGVAIYTQATPGVFAETYITSGAVNPSAIGIDSGHNIWELDSYVQKLFKLNSAGSSTIDAAGSGVTIPAASAVTFMIDGSGNVLVPSCNTHCSGSGADSLVFFNNSGALISGRSGLQDASMNHPGSVAVDPSGNAWVSSIGNGAVTEFVGIASPLVTPLSQALTLGTIATKP